VAIDEKGWLKNPALVRCEYGVFMPRQSTTEAAESEHLARLAIAPEDKALKSSLFATFVHRLATQLRADVKSALESEASSEIADEWIQEATSALKTLAPDLPEDLKERAAFQSALERTQRELSTELRKDILKPSDTEIQRESTELAQCTLANWFTLLEHAKEDSAADVLPLTANGIPVNRSFDDLFAGVEAFALARGKLAAHFDDFLTSLVDPGNVCTLAPELFFARKAPREFFVAKSDEAARDIVRVTHQEPQSHQNSIVDLIPELIGARSAAAATAGTAFGAAAGDASLSTNAENYLARVAAWLAQTMDTGEPSSAEDLQRVLFSHLESANLVASQTPLESTSNKFSSDLAEIALLDLNRALGSGPIDRIMNWSRRHRIENSLKSEVHAAVDEQTMSSLRRVAAVAAGYVVGSQLTADEFNEPNDLEGLAYLLDNSPAAQTVLCFSASAAHQAASLPNAAMVCTRMSRQFHFPDRSV
jgi:hypothetical protein